MDRGPLKSCWLPHHSCQDLAPVWFCAVVGCGLPHLESSSNVRHLKNQWTEVMLTSQLNFPLLFLHLHLFTTQCVSTLQPVQTDACQIVPGVRIWRVWSSSWHSLVVSRGYKLKSGLLQTCPNISTHHKTPELPWITRILYRTMPKYMATHATTHLHEWSYPARWIPTVCWLAGAEVRFHA